MAAELLGDLGLEKSASELVTYIRDLCEAIDNVVILAMDGQCAAEAVRDQVLGEGAGKVTDHGERVGAVDASIVRDAVRLVDGDLDELVFLTGDKNDFARATKHLGVSGFRYAQGTDFLLSMLKPPPKKPTLPKWWDAFAVIVSSLMRDQREAQEADDRSGPPPSWLSSPISRWATWTSTKNATLKNCWTAITRRRRR